MGIGLRDVVDVFDYECVVAETAPGVVEESSEGDNSLSEDETMRTGVRPGVSGVEPSLGQATTAPCREVSPPLSPLPEETPPKRYPGKRKAPLRNEESDDEATFDIGLNHVVGLTRQAEVEGSLMKEVPGTHLQYLLEQISLSCQALTELRSSDMPRRKKRHDSEEEATAQSALVGNLAGQVAVLRGVIDKRRGMGVHKEVQEATKKLEEILATEKRRRATPRSGTIVASPERGSGTLAPVFAKRKPTTDAGTQTAVGPQTNRPGTSDMALRRNVATQTTEELPNPRSDPLTKPGKKRKKKKEKRLNTVEGTASSPTVTLPEKHSDRGTAAAKSAPASVDTGAETERPTWTEVVRRKGGLGKTEETATRPRPPPPTRGPAAKKLRARVPRTEAVIIDPLKGDLKYAEVMKTATASVDLLALGIQVSGTRRTQTGAVLLEVRGSAEKADLLATKLEEALKEKDVRVHRPSMTRTVLIRDVEDWHEEDEVRRALSDALECPSVGPVIIRPNIGGKGRYARCDVPVKVAIRLTTVSRIKVGWTNCRLRIIDKGPQCYRCLEYGHIAHSCKVRELSQVQKRWAYR
ncbi:uncharacterized protein LOC126899367 [Daktulosphaira vitifoliae]|uniref:uncharacterized protein LOC126899367 n=1 Tax=Daktulosphaira vitifoliae TaxID=58002 RepID=UPI0021AA71DB|nr:uncharacterized protein LOC126899367 [Daktulosphaira vitifoliae]